MRVSPIAVTQAKQTFKRNVGRLFIHGCLTMGKYTEDNLKSLFVAFGNKQREERDFALEDVLNRVSRDWSVSTVVIFDNGDSCIDYHHLHTTLNGVKEEALEQTIADFKKHESEFLLAENTNAMKPLSYLYVISPDPKYRLNKDIKRMTSIITENNLFNVEYCNIEREKLFSRLEEEKYV